ncbi:MFS transporter [Penicillium hetheringtonii]|uniref:MFS transporter n=1 Tax=Penicillium hetheringtonii TaxID=911720 RepID=A0AAD6GWT0_9EURO|nr:MFS transporter [Penicillium hetheringtonii]
MTPHGAEDVKDTLQSKHLESLIETGFSEEETAILREYKGTKGKKVIRKIDCHLIPVLAFLYLCSHVDRNNLGNAKIEGMNSDLGLVGNQYNIASTLFFVPYIIFEIPSNIMLKKARPSYWLAAQVVIWGIVMTCMGSISGFAIYLVTQWYPPNVIQQRLALLYTASAISGAFSGLLAFAIAKMDGLRGLAGWRWIFILEGIVPTLFGLLLPFFLPDSPKKVGWLTDKEKLFINICFRQTGHRSTTVLMAMTNAAPNAAFSYTMPAIIHKLGFQASKAQLLTIPPYFCGAVSSWLSGRLADRFTWRFPFIAIPMVLMLISFILLLILSANTEGYKGPMYFAVILAQIGIYPLLPGISAWTGNNLPQSWKRSIGIAWLLAAGNTGSFIGTNVFLEDQAPHYTIGYGVSIGIICMGIMACCTLEFSLWRLNKKKSGMDESEARETYSPEQLVRMGEESPLYRYTL